jgi:EAL domain-containing protein (putative c-di-GMP-specific phosphodiesterase class I)/CheY-like chemotaxis protein
MRDLAVISSLVVDNDPSTAKILEWALKKSGVETIETHTNALRALTQIIGGEMNVGLILCDLSMPHMDGVEFFRRLTEIGYDGGLIVVSGEDRRVIDMVRRLARVQKLNLVGYLEKPVKLESLKVLIAQWMHQLPVSVQQVEAPVSADEIRHGLASREFVNFYQPQVNVSTGAVVGVESLVRWHRDSEGIVGPGRFIEVAETHGLIDDLTHYVVTKALAQNKAWQDLGLKLSVSINVSMDNLAHLDFPELMAFEAARAGIGPSCIVLEVTESRLMKDPMAVLDVLTRLRLKRFRLSIDDFGTGYSSLAQLRDIAFDELKVDLSFVHGACDDPKMQAIVEGSLRIAKQLDMTVVAEGVEDRADWDYIRRTRCDLAQGYFIAKPMPAEEILDWLADWRKRLPELMTVINKITRWTPH